MKNLFAAAIAAVAAASFAAPASAALVVSPATIGQRVVVQSAGEVVARYEAQTAGYTSNLFLDGRAGAIFNNQGTPVGTTVSLGSFAAGTELVFRIDVLNTGDTFFTGPAARNADGVAHAAVSTEAGRSFVGFEDLRGGGDRDYDDLIFSFTNTAAAGAVPEPATWGLMLAGFGLVGAGLRTRRRSTSVRFA